MKLLNKKIAALCLVTPLVVLAGCATPGASGNSGEAGDALTERAIYSSLFSESTLADNSILVGCVDGVVTLTGQVDDGIEKQLAERLAAGTPGVTEVVNSLTTRS